MMLGLSIHRLEGVFSEEGSMQLRLPVGTLHLCVNMLYINRRLYIFAVVDPH